MSVPPVPALDAEIVDAHARAHRQLADRHGAAADDVRRLFAAQQRRIVIESIAYVRPPFTRRTDLPLVVPPRAFLTPAQERRMMGCTTLFRHIDSRSAMMQAGFTDVAIDRSTLAVMHALAESVAPSGHARETNPGMFRTVLTAWENQPVDFTHPPAGEVSSLVEEAIDVANEHDVPGCVRAGWLTFTLLSIHPFVDGNGRTSRSAYMAVAGPDLPLGIDWGVLEQWAVWRGQYMVAVQLGQAAGVFDPPQMDAGPFVEFATRSSIGGAELCARRIEFIARRLEALERNGLAREHAAIRTFVQMWRTSTLAELVACGLGDEASLDRAVAEMLADGLVRWVPRPHSRRTFDRPEEFGLVAS